MKEQYIKEKYGVEKDKTGVISKHVGVEADNENAYVCSLIVNKVSVIGEDRDSFELALSASILKHVFKEHFSPEQIKGTRPYVLLEIPKGFFEDYIQTACEETEGAHYAISADNKNPGQIIFGDKDGKE